MLLKWTILISQKKNMQVALRKASEFQNTATSLSKDFSFLILGKRKASLDTQIGGFHVNLTKKPEE